MPDFTGERLIPGQVDGDLWNEHMARYAFAGTLCSKGMRVLDAGCGTGYGSTYLARCAEHVIGVDVSEEAIAFASPEYGGPQIVFSVALCEKLPLGDSSIDLIVAFEVIEHLVEWHAFLEECRRVLSPTGLLIVSTPNKVDYSESRGNAGPNPFHVHEFEFAEFSDELLQVFPFVRLFGQTRAESIVFSSVTSRGTNSRFESHPPPPERAAFFVAVCGAAEPPNTGNFIFVPETANLLRERERHITLLRTELELKDSNLTTLHAEHASLVNDFRGRQAEVERSNEWAATLNGQLAEKGARVEALQDAFAEEQRRSGEEIRRLQGEFERIEAEHRSAVETLLAQTSHLEQIVDERTHWARGLDLEIARIGEHLARCVEYLHTAEETLEQRTQELSVLRTRFESMEQETDDLRTRLQGYDDSRWVKLGRAIHLGPLSR